MTRDEWPDYLEARGTAARDWALKSPAIFSDPSITFEGVTRLYENLEEHAQAIERAINQLEEEEAHGSPLSVAESIDDMISNLAAAIAEKMIALRRGQP